MRPLKVPTIAKGGVNYEGLTWEEWDAAARAWGNKPANMSEEADWALAWRCGEDPTEYATRREA